MKIIVIALSLLFILFVTALILSAVYSYRANIEKENLKDPLPVTTARQRQFKTEAQRKADERDQKHASVLLWSFIFFVLGYLVYNFLIQNKIIS